ncbi:CBS domain-containing protein [Candidatus Micrarchaeota archaeon]|nr:CBS domain-containing protein [Candidatus Micrarchaeota archaeon]
MLPDVKEIKSRRLKLGLNQTQLANASGVSQSLIAKIESGKIDCSYSKTKSIFDALEKIEEKSDLTAKNIMNSHIYSIQEKSSLQDAVQIMRKHGISQLIVQDGSQMTGSISEKDLLDKIALGWKSEQLTRAKVSEVMQDAFPTINEDTPLKIASALLEKTLAVIVIKKNKPAGIITKTDLLKTL